MVCGDLPQSHDLNVNQFENNNGAYIHADKKSVLKWFGSLKEANRVEFVSGLFQLCSPVELRFYGSCLEDIARKDFFNLRQYDVRANSVNGFADLDQLKKSLSESHVENSEETCMNRNLPPPFNALMFNAELRNNLIITLSLLRSNNHSSAHYFFSALLADSIRNSELNSIDAISDNWNDNIQYHPSTDLLQSLDWPAIDECLLIYTLAAFHPAFSFSQRKFLFERLLKMNTWCSMCQHVRNFRLTVFENNCRPVRSPFDCKTLKPGISKHVDKNSDRRSTIKKRLRRNSVPCLHRLDNSNHEMESEGYALYNAKSTAENSYYNHSLRPSVSARSFVGQSFSYPKKSYICSNCSRIVRKGRSLDSYNSHKRSKSVGDYTNTNISLPENTLKSDYENSLGCNGLVNKNNTAVVHLKSTHVQDERQVYSRYSEPLNISFPVNVSTTTTSYPLRSSQMGTSNLAPAINVPSPSILTPQPMTLVKNLSPSGRNTLLKLESANNTLVAYNAYGLPRTIPKCISNDLNVRTSNTANLKSTTAPSSSSSQYSGRKNLAFLESNSYRRIPCSSHCCRPLPPPRRHSSASSHLSTPPSEESSSGNNTSGSECFRPKSIPKVKCCQNTAPTPSSSNCAPIDHQSSDNVDGGSENQEDIVQNTITRSSLEQDSSIANRERFFITSSEDEENNKNANSIQFNVSTVSSNLNMNNVGSCQPSIYVRNTIPPQSMLPHSTLCTYGNPVYGNSFNYVTNNSFQSNASSFVNGSVPQGYSYSAPQSNVNPEPGDTSSVQNLSNSTCDSSSLNVSTTVTYSLANNVPESKATESNLNQMNVQTPVVNNAVIETNGIARQYLVIPTTQYGGSSRFGAVQTPIEMPNSESIIWSPNPTGNIAPNVCYPTAPQTNVVGINPIHNPQWGCYPLYATPRSEVIQQTQSAASFHSNLAATDSQSPSIGDNGKNELINSYDSITEEKGGILTKEDATEDNSITNTDSNENDQKAKPNQMTEAPPSANVIPDGGGAQVTQTHPAVTYQRNVAVGGNPSLVPPFTLHNMHGHHLGPNLISLVPSNSLSYGFHPAPPPTYMYPPPSTNFTQQVGHANQSPTNDAQRSSPACSSEASQHPKSVGIISTSTVTTTTTSGQMAVVSAVISSAAEKTAPHPTEAFVSHSSQNYSCPNSSNGVIPPLVNAANPHQFAPLLLPQNIPSHLYASFPSLQSTANSVFGSQVVQQTAPAIPFNQTPFLGVGQTLPHMLQSNHAANFQYPLNNGHGSNPAAAVPIMQHLSSLSQSTANPHQGLASVTTQNSFSQTHASTSRQYNQIRPQKSCFNCGQLGHLAFKCPEKTISQTYNEGTYNLDFKNSK